MDADVEHDWEWEKAQWDGTEESRKRLVQKYMDEVYALDFNDMVRMVHRLLRNPNIIQVGDLPTRFKYVEVPASSYALDPVEMLLATDKELNEYMSIKRLAPYKTKQNWDKDRTAKLMELKQLLATRTWDGVPASQWTSSSQRNRGGGDGQKKKKRMGKKERKKLKSAATSVGEEAEVGDGPLPNEAQSNGEPPTKKRKYKA